MDQTEKESSGSPQGAKSTQPNERALLRWRKRNSYYYKWLERIYKFVVRPGSRVLHVGCDCGDLLAAVEPSYGVGIDADADAIELAKKRFGRLSFYSMDPHELELDDKFDYVLICNSLGGWHDIQGVLERIVPLTKPSTRIVITYYNHLWEGILSLGSLLRIRKPNTYQNWLPAEDISNLLELSGFDVIRTASYLMMPKRIPPLTILCAAAVSLLQPHQSRGCPAPASAFTRRGLVGLGDSPMQKRAREYRRRHKANPPNGPRDGDYLR